MECVIERNDARPFAQPDESPYLWTGEYLTADHGIPLLLALPEDFGEQPRDLSTVKQPLTSVFASLDEPDILHVSDHEVVNIFITFYSYLLPAVNSS